MPLDINDPRFRDSPEEVQERLKRMADHAGARSMLIENGLSEADADSLLARCAHDISPPGRPPYDLRRQRERAKGIAPLAMKLRLQLTGWAHTRQGEYEAVQAIAERARRVSSRPLRKGAQLNPKTERMVFRIVDELARGAGCNLTAHPNGRFSKLVRAVLPRDIGGPMLGKHLLARIIKDVLTGPTMTRAWFRAVGQLVGDFAATVQIESEIDRADRT